MRNGKVTHRNTLLHDDDFSIVQRFQQEYRGLVQYYVLAQNLSWFSKLYWTMETALLKTLACKHRSSINKQKAKYKTTTTSTSGKTVHCLQVVVERPGKKPLVATWGGISLAHKRKAVIEDTPYKVYGGRTELIKRLTADTCELCGSSKDIEVMYKELLGFVAKVKDPYLSKLLKSLFVEDVEFAKAFKFSSAAKTVHHGFVGGLLEHTLSVTKLCEYYVNYYPMINADLLYTAAMCHDIGKVYELSPFPENDYTDEGQLLGHIMIGAEMVGDRIRDIPGFPIKLGNELKHCILAHHGELEYGSPKKPALLEAVALNFADNTDAHLQTMIEALTAAGENQGWLGYNRLFESNIRKTSK